MVKKIIIGRKEISEASRPFIVAEAGVNYYDIAKKKGISVKDAAKLMIEEAAKAGADAIKFQTYKAEKLAAKDSPAYWDITKETTKSQYELFKKFDVLDEKDYAELAKYAEKNKIIFMSTPFDIDAAGFLDSMVPVFKIASADITNIPLIKKIARNGKPIFLSTGASTIDEIKNAVKTIEEEGNKQVVLLHCILNYPTKYEDANLCMIKELKKIFPDKLIGYSDHSMPDENMSPVVTAANLGAKVIEKHFTLDKTLPGNDHYHAMDEKDLKKFMEIIKGNRKVEIPKELAKKLVGEIKEGFFENELMARKYARRSIVANMNIPKGTIITEEMLICKRPGTGISPLDMNKVIGRKAKRNIKGDYIITFEMLE